MCGKSQSTCQIIAQMADIGRQVLEGLSAPFLESILSNHFNVC